MRLVEAIIDANHRALAGDPSAGLQPAEYAEELPLAALSCIDPRLNPLLPAVLGVPPDQFIWLRNAGNIITGPTSSTMRSLALACAVKGAKEIAIIGHTDCLISKTGTMQLLERFRVLGIERNILPDNLNEYFGLFSSERQNVIKGVEVVRQSPLIGPKVFVQGLLVDIVTGKLEWLVNGYQTLDTFHSRVNDVARSAGRTLDSLKALVNFEIGEMKFPESKIGEMAENWLSGKVPQIETLSEKAPAEKPATPPKVPLPPLLRPRVHLTKNRK